ncbi:BA75_03436T0 [Komagataella pastoris]|uniref:BA75_03436T0 n=1 Tax=Komagataella pastoris TaxID=4922 RepID=A0A1B2JER0_PICPA|nr:BA75_03436T0 [Komagataella pastoris]
MEAIELVYYMSVGSVKLVTQYLSSQGRKKLLNDLVENLVLERADESSEVLLSELLDVISEDEKEPVLAKLHLFAIRILNNQNYQISEKNGFSSILMLSQKLSKLTATLVDHVIGNLSRFVETEKGGLNFETGSRDLIDNYTFGKPDLCEPIQEDVSTAMALRLLSFIEVLSRDALIGHQPTIDFYACILLGFDDDKIRECCSQIIRWRISFIKENSEMNLFVWDVIQLLMNSPNQKKVILAFVFWLRYLNEQSIQSLSMNSEYQEALQRDQYWSFLKAGLMSKVHEQRKYALSIIKLTVNSIARSFENSFIKWEISLEDRNLALWRKFCTLYEIIGLDTSLHQAKAASRDIISILIEDSAIKFPFALIILSIGFHASMESVRKFSLELVLSIPSNRLHLLHEDNYEFLKNTFFPFVFTANYYNTIRTESGYECPFGDKVIKFLSGCLQDLSQKQHVRRLTHVVLEMLDINRMTFDPARLYIVQGLLQGLNRLQSSLNHVIVEEDLSLLYRIFERVAENEIFQLMTQTINLRLLLFADFDRVGFGGLLQALAKFIKINGDLGYAILSDQIDFFLDSVSENFQKQELLAFYEDNKNQLAVENFIVYLALIIPNNKSMITLLATDILHHPQSWKILIQLKANTVWFSDIVNEPVLSSRMKQLVSNMINSPSSCSDIYFENTNCLIEDTNVFSHTFWNNTDLTNFWINISTEFGSSNEVTLTLATAKFGFFVEVLQQCVSSEVAENFLTWEKVLYLGTTSFQNQPKNTSTTFYRVKDQYYGSLFRMIQILAKISKIDGTFKKKVHDLVAGKVSFAGYYGKLEAINLLHLIIQLGHPLTIEESLSLVQILEVIWDDLTIDRLILNQRPLHLTFIELAFSVPVLSCSLETSGRLSRSLKKLALQIIDNGYGRKSLLPTMINCLSSFQLRLNDGFEKSFWLGEVLVYGFFLQQLNNNLCRLELILGSIYDREFNFDGDRIYERVYGAEEVSFRVNIAAILASIKSSTFAFHIWNFILTNNSIFHLQTPVKRNDGIEEWKRIQLLCVMVLTIKAIGKSDLVKLVTVILTPLLFKETSPLCRVYIEWIISYTMLNDTHSRDAILGYFKDDIDNQQPTYMTTFERISYLVIKKLDFENESQELTNFLVNYVIPSSSSNRALIRHFSVSLVCSVIPEITNKKLDVPKAVVRSLENIYNLALKSEGFGTYRSGDALIWDITEDLTLVGICGGVLLKVSDRYTEFICQREFAKYVSEEQKAKLLLPIGQDQREQWVYKSTEKPKSGKDSFLASDADIGTLLQTKSGTWSTVMDVDGTNENGHVRKRSDLIVMGSLVDKPPNLGGICRLSDVLGAGLLTLGDLRVKDNIQFKNVAVTADKWMPLEEVKRDNIIEFMLRKKRQGYTLIGLEQTDDSVELDSKLKFPKKSLIVLGMEKEGIPSAILAELDFCVEIKQVGVVRSMNIQTATAVIVHAYAIQHC